MNEWQKQRRKSLTLTWREDVNLWDAGKGQMEEVPGTAEVRDKGWDGEQEDGKEGGLHFPALSSPCQETNPHRPSPAEDDMRCCANLEGL